MPTRTLASNGAVFSFQITNSVPTAANAPINLNPNLEKIEGYYAGSGNAWLQFYDANSVPSNGVSNFLREIEINGPNGFIWQYMNDPLNFQNLTNGLIVVVSTTEGTLTIGTGANKATFFVSLEDWEIATIGGTLTGGGAFTTTASLTVWADSIGNSVNKLTRVEIGSYGPFSNSFNAIFLQLFATTPTLNMVPVRELVALPLSSNGLIFRFGRRGVPIFSQDVNGTDHYGCFLGISQTPNSWDNSITVPMRGQFITTA